MLSRRQYLYNTTLFSRLCCDRKPNFCPDRDHWKRFLEWSVPHASHGEETAVDNGCISAGLWHWRQRFASWMCGQVRATKGLWLRLGKVLDLKQRVTWSTRQEALLKSVNQTRDLSLAVTKFLLFCETLSEQKYKKVNNVLVATRGYFITWVDIAGNIF